MPTRTAANSIFANVAPPTKAPAPKTPPVNRDADRSFDRVLKHQSKLAEPAKAEQKPASVAIEAKRTGKPKTAKSESRDTIEQTEAPAAEEVAVNAIDARDEMQPISEALPGEELVEEVEAKPAPVKESDDEIAAEVLAAMVIPQAVESRGLVEIEEPEIAVSIEAVNVTPPALSMERLLDGPTAVQVAAIEEAIVPPAEAGETVNDAARVGLPETPDVEIFDDVMPAQSAVTSTVPNTDDAVEKKESEPVAKPTPTVSPLSTLEKKEDASTEQRDAQDGKSTSQEKLAATSTSVEQPVAIFNSASKFEAVDQAAKSKAHELEPATPTLTPVSHHAEPNQVASVKLAAPAPPPEVRFALDNHDQIVSTVKTNLMPNGGTMTLRLNPPELGAMQLNVRMDDGVMSASFETSSDHATRMLSHSLSDLRSSLEGAGIVVDKLHVEQSPKSETPQHRGNESRQQHENQTSDSPRREQERRELLQRMWRRLTEGSDPLDMVA